MIITVKHIITFDDKTLTAIQNLTAALSGDTDKRVGELADKVKTNTDTLEDAVNKNKGSIS